MAGVCVGHPFDTVKVLMQTRSKYTSPWHCLTSLVQEKGIRSLFNGIIPPLGIATAVNAVLFFSYEFSLRIIRRLQRSDEQALRPTLTQIFAAGSLSGLAQIGLGVPAEVPKQNIRTAASNLPAYHSRPVQVIKCKQQAGSYASVGDCVRKVAPSQLPGRPRRASRGSCRVRLKTLSSGSHSGRPCAFRWHAGRSRPKRVTAVTGSHDYEP